MVASTFIPDAYIFPIKPDQVDAHRTAVVATVASTETENLFGFQWKVLAKIGQQIPAEPKTYKTNDIMQLIKNNWPEQWQNGPQEAITKRQIAMLLDLQKYHTGITRIVGSEIGSETPRYDKYGY